MTLIIVIAIIAVIVFSIIGIYNNLVKLRNNRENAFADIDVQLMKRNCSNPLLLHVLLLPAQQALTTK